MSDKEFITKYNGCTIYSNIDTSYCIDESLTKFKSIQEAKDFIDYMYDDDVDIYCESMLELSEDSRRKKKKNVMG